MLFLILVVGSLLNTVDTYSPNTKHQIKTGAKMSTKKKKVINGPNFKDKKNSILLTDSPIWKNEEN